MPALPECISENISAWRPKQKTHKPLNSHFKIWRTASVNSTRPLEHARHNTQTRGPNGSGRVLSGVSLRAQECMQLLEGGLQPNSNSATRAIGYRQGLESLLQWQADPASLTPSSMVGLKVNKRKPIP